MRVVGWPSRSLVHKQKLKPRLDRLSNTRFSLPFPPGPCSMGDRDFVEWFLHAFIEQFVECPVANAGHFAPKAVIVELDLVGSVALRNLVLLGNCEYLSNV